jgi:hypothetical protein
MGASSERGRLVVALQLPGPSVGPRSSDPAV